MRTIRNSSLMIRSPGICGSIRTGSDLTSCTRSAWPKKTLIVTTTSCPSSFRSQEWSSPNCPNQIRGIGLSAPLFRPPMIISSNFTRGRIISYFYTSVSPLSRIYSIYSARSRPRGNSMTRSKLTPSATGTISI